MNFELLSFNPKPLNPKIPQGYEDFEDGMGDDFEDAGEGRVLGLRV